MKMAQPFGAFAKTMMEKQVYPDLREYPGGPPQRPYDVTAHTLPLLLGVEVATVEAPFAADLEPIDAATVAPGRLEGAGPMIALGHGNGDLVAAGRLLRAGVPVEWATEAFSDANRSFAAGSLLVPASARDRLEPLVRELGITGRAIATRPRALRLRGPRVGLYQSWVPSMDEGWTRFVFEREAGVDYVTLHDADVRAGGLSERFDAIVLPDQPPTTILNGHLPGSMPDEYVGGLGEAGGLALKAFVEAGGTLVALNAATGFAIERLALPVRNTLAGFDSASFYCPGAILRAQVDQSHPLAHGLLATMSLWFEASPGFEVREGAAVLRYVDEDPLLSGWLLGGRELRGRAALADVPLGRGHVVLFGFRPQYRAQSWATYVPLLNALYLAAAEAPVAGFGAGSSHPLARLRHAASGS